MNEWTFADEVRLSPIHVPRAALYMAQALAYPRLDVPAVLQRLLSLADVAAQEIAHDLPNEQRATLLSQFLFSRYGLRGNAQDYADPRNSFLNDVLERRLGIPISLAVIYVEVARLLNIAAYGVGLPGHFIVGVEAEETPKYLDPFHAGRWLSQADCAHLVRTTSGYEGPFQQAWLQPTPPPEIVARMLNNLRTIYVQQREWGKAVKTIALLRQVQPDTLEHVRDLGLVHYRKGTWRLAARYLEEYLRQRPDAPDLKMIQTGMRQALDAWVRLN